MILGNSSENTVLNTRGRLYIKVGDASYELDFRGKQVSDLKKEIETLKNDYILLEARVKALEDKDSE